MILLIAILVWPVVVLVCVLSFRRTIANVLNSADEAEIGPHGVKWRKSSQRDQANAIQAPPSTGEPAQRMEPR